MPDLTSEPPAPGSVPCVPAAVATALQDALTLYADHFRCRMSCSFDVAALSTLAACHMGLTIWHVDTETTLRGPHVVTDPGNWPQ